MEIEKKSKIFIDSPGKKYFFLCIVFAILSIGIFRYSFISSLEDFFAFCYNTREFLNFFCMRIAMIEPTILNLCDDSIIFSKAPNLGQALSSSIKDTALGVLKKQDLSLSDRCLKRIALQIKENEKAKIEAFLRLEHTKFSRNVFASSI